MESHKRILGIIYVVTGILLMMAMMALWFFSSLFVPWIVDNASQDTERVLTWLLPFISAIPVLACLFIALPSLVAGWGLLNNRSWAMLLACIVGCLRLLSFRIGTAIGVYTIWIYIEDKRLKTGQPL